MTIHPLVGHGAEQNRVIRALMEGRLPQGILITGPAGVGKQRFGLWLGQAILCEAESRPCGGCRSCRQVLGLAHPDPVSSGGDPRLGRVAARRRLRAGPP